MGVKRAVDSALAAPSEHDGPMYTLGPLIHNRQVVERLEARGVHICEHLDDIDAGTVVIRAHGVPPETVRRIKDAGLEIIDATCPHVLSSQRAIRRHSSAGCQVVIAGDKDHAETVGLMGYCVGPSVAIGSVEEAEEVELAEQVCLIAQTTFNEAAYEEIAETIRRRRPSAVVLNTICKATRMRQDECRELAANVDAMVVVGGYHSANSRRLAEIAHSTGTPTFHIETVDDLDESELAKFGTVGVTAGASTPNWTVRAVIRRLEEIGRRGTFARLLRRGVEALVQSSIYAGLGAMGLTYACYLLQRGTSAPDLRWFLVISFCYIFSVHIWHRTRQRADDPSVTSRMAFFSRNSRLLTAMSFVLMIGSLCIGAVLGMWTFLILAASYAIGVVYNVRVIPTRWRWLPYQRLKDIPASKDVFSAAGWATVAVVLPSLPAAETDIVKITAAFIIAFTAGFIRATMLDFTDIQADRLTGRDTLPTVVGTRKTLATLTVMAATMAAMLLAMTAAGLFFSLGYWMLTVPIYIAAYLHVFRRQVVLNETICLLVADGTLLLMGVVALVWVRMAG